MPISDIAVTADIFPVEFSPLKRKYAFTIHLQIIVYDLVP